MTDETDSDAKIVNDRLSKLCPGCVNFSRLQSKMSRISSILRISSIFRIPKSSVKYSTPSGEQDKDWKKKFRRFAYEWTGYNRYGLYSDDMIDKDIPAVKEAVRRLPKDVRDARTFRIIRAIQLDFVKTYLPKEKWITFEQDQAYRYLIPYIDEVEAERKERYDFGCVNYSEQDWPSSVVN